MTMTPEQAVAALLARHGLTLPAIPERPVYVMGQGGIKAYLVAFEVYEETLARVLSDRDRIIRQAMALG
jgi:hypothetical protein